MTTVRMKCDELGCHEYLDVDCDDEYGPWRGADADALVKAARKARWSQRIEWDGMAFIHCPKHKARRRG